VRASSMGPLHGEVLSYVAAYAVSLPKEAFQWSLASSEISKMLHRYGLWSQVVSTLSWPPSSSRGKSSRADAFVVYQRLGIHCKSLSIDGVRSEADDLRQLAKHCPAVHAVELLHIGSQGIHKDVWRAWAQCLRKASLSFFYDAVDGAPPIREVLLDILVLCPQLESLAIAGIDWKSAVEACVRVLSTTRSSMHQRGVVPKLQRLELVGSEAVLSEDAEAMLKRVWPGLSLRARLLATPNLDW